jgi:pyruvate/2-oxoglutarate dehydrogenase complex dihydrolipoamide acyltransferase (E2) component
MALHAWSRPKDPTVYGVMDIDARSALGQVAELRKATGRKITLTHLIGKALAIAIAERPEVNAIVRRGRLYVRDSIDIFFQVAFEGGENLAGAKVEGVDQKSVAEIAEALERRAERIRTKKDDPTQLSARRLSRLPPALVNLAMRVGESLTYDYDLNLSKLGVPYDAFGSAMITNVAGFGLTVGQAPLFPPSRVPIVLTVGAVHDAPAVVDGQVVVRPTLTIGASFDHRLLDGFQAGKLAKRFHEALENADKELL